MANSLGLEQQSPLVDEMNMENEIINVYFVHPIRLKLRVLLLVGITFHLSDRHCCFLSSCLFFCSFLAAARAGLMLACAQALY